MALQRQTRDGWWNVTGYPPVVGHTLSSGLNPKHAQATTEHTT
jgi:hypothetical protein